MVKRSLLAAQRGDGGGTFIRGLRAMHLSTNTEAPLVAQQVTTVVQVPTPEPASSDQKKRKAPSEPKKPRKKAKVEEEEIKPTETKVCNYTRSKNVLIENIYGTEEAAKKRRIMETKSLDKVTTVREAFEVCLFKAERTESDAEKTKVQLQQTIENLSMLRKTRAKLADITKCEEQVRQLRAKMTKTRSNHQSPIDVIVNVAKFSLANASVKEETAAELKEEKPAFSKELDNVGSIATISLANTHEVLQKYLNDLVKNRDTPPKPIKLPTLKYNWCDPFATRLAKQFIENDSVAYLHWVLEDYQIKSRSERVDEEEEEDDDDDDDDLFDDSREKEWLSKNSIDTVEQLLVNAEILNHPKSHTWDEIQLQKKQMQAECAKIVAQRLMSLFFRQDTNLETNESEKSNATVADQNAANSGKKKISLVKIGQLQKSAAIGGKSRNRVRNKMKPARNTDNVSIFNFLRVQMHERSDKHVAAERFINYMQNFERQNGEKGNNHSMFSTFMNQEQQQAQTTAVVNPKKRKLDAIIGDCNNASESLPLPNYSSPTCTVCGAPVHISKRTGMETCTSPSCAATVYRPTGFDIIHLEQQVHNTYQYLLTVHMKSTLRRVQGKESAIVPKRVKDAVKERLEMERFDIKYLTAKKVKDVLKKLDLSAWYNHRHKICASITGKKPYQFTAEEEDVILAVFERLIEPYNLYRPKTDENFPYYRYALHKILQLLGYPNDVLKDFPILKSRKNHQRKETIWGKMMDYHGWPKYKS